MAESLGVVGRFCAAERDLDGFFETQRKYINQTGKYNDRVKGELEEEMLKKKRRATIALLQAFLAHLEATDKDNFVESCKELMKHFSDEIVDMSKYIQGVPDLFVEMLSTVTTALVVFGVKRA